MQVEVNKDQYIFSLFTYSLVKGVLVLALGFSEQNFSFLLEEMEFVEALEDEFDLYHFDEVEGVLQGFLGVENPLRVVFADVALELQTDPTVEVFAQNDRPDARLGCFHHLLVLGRRCHRRGQSVEQGQRQFVEAYSAVASFVLPLPNDLLVPDVKEHVKLNPQVLLPLLLGVPQLLALQNLSLQHVGPDCFSGVRLILLFEVLVCGFLRAFLFFGAGEAVAIEEVFDAVEADVLVEQVLVLSDLNVLLVVLLLVLALPHAEQHLSQVGVHLLVQSALDASKRRQVSQTALQKLQTLGCCNRLRNYGRPAHPEVAEHLGIPDCLLQQLPHQSPHNRISHLQNLPLPLSSRSVVFLLRLRLTLQLK